MNQSVKQALATDKTIDITTTGKRSGLLRRTEIWFMYIKERVFITGTPGPRDWYANLVAHPDFTFHIKEATKIDLKARAYPVIEPEERHRIMSAPETEWYRNQATMENLISGSPMVEVLID